ncbi:MAG: BadF/BadG/BcrA/BcrD ATPase family protein [Caldilineaceae bacterium]
MATVLGIDGGATKTHAIIMDETGAVLGEGFGSVGNYTVVGADGAQQSFADAVAAARAAAGLDAAPFRRRLSRAGQRGLGDRPQHHPPNRGGAQHGRTGKRGAWTTIAVSRWRRRAGGPASCRSAAPARPPSARRGREGWRVGGWGRTISDEGSACWMGVEAMRAAVRAYDGKCDGGERRCWARCSISSGSRTSTSSTSRSTCKGCPKPRSPDWRG